MAPDWSVVISSWRKVCKLYSLKNLVSGLRYAGWYLQLSNVKPTQFCSAPAASQVILANYFSDPPLFSGPIAFFASYWSAGLERFCKPPALGSQGGREDLQAVRQVS